MLQTLKHTFRAYRHTSHRGELELLLATAIRQLTQKEITSTISYFLREKELLQQIDPEIRKERKMESLTHQLSGSIYKSTKTNFVLKFIAIFDKFLQKEFENMVWELLCINCTKSCKIKFKVILA